MIIFGRFTPIKHMKISYKKYQVKDECFEYKFIDIGLIVEIYFEKTPFIKKIVSLKIKKKQKSIYDYYFKARSKQNNAVKKYFYLGFLRISYQTSKIKIIRAILSKRLSVL